MKRITAFALIAIICFASLTSCELLNKSSEADVLLKDFVSALVIEDYETASTLVHPDSEMTALLLEEMVNEIQEKLNIDIRKGVVYGACTQFYLNSNSSLNGGAITTWEIGYEVEIDGRIVELQATVYEDSKGMGVLSFELKVGAGF